MHSLAESAAMQVWGRLTQTSSGAPGMVAAQVQIAWESRFAGLPPPIDGVDVDVAAADPLADDARRAQQLGFSGKLCIHPNQVAIVNAAFVPSEKERVWVSAFLRKLERRRRDGGGRRKMVDCAAAARHIQDSQVEARTITLQQVA